MTQVQRASPSFRVVGKENGYPLDMSFVANDPYVEEAITTLVGAVPAELHGWTRSGASLAKLRDGVEKYNRTWSELPRDEYFSKAVDRAFGAFRIPKKLKVLDVSDVPFQPDTSAGYSFFGSKKRDVIDELVSLARRLEKEAHRGHGLRGSAPCLTFMRTQLAKVETPKVRAVWGFPGEVTLLEGKFASPLIEGYAEFSSPMFIGRSMEFELPMFINHIGHHRYGVSIDWSGFDSSVGPGLIKLAFKVLAQNFEFSDKDDLLWKALMKYFINTRIKFPDGTVYKKDGGIPSGSYFTQLVGSVINFIVISYLQLRVEGQFYNTRVLGDDSIFGCEIAPNLREWEKLAFAVFGMKLSSAKSQVTSETENMEFLGHFSKSGRLYRDPVKLARLMLYPERRVASPEVSMSRALGLFRDSGGGHLFPYTIAAIIWAKYRKDPDPNFSERYVRYVLGGHSPPSLRGPISLAIS